MEMYLGFRRLYNRWRHRAALLYTERKYGESTGSGHQREYVVLFLLTGVWRTRSEESAVFV